ncbi:MAG: DUF4834 family protein [Bacteroidetes bacterium]|nr:DUF4834 family protein [Bacteroidota bacterium]
MGFISFVLTTIIIFFVVGYVGKILLRLWLTQKMRQFNGEQTTNKSDSSWFGRKNNKKEGSVKVTKLTEDAHKVDGKVGEYVEYEEVNEDK